MIAGPTETEINLLVDSGARAEIRRHPVFARAKPHERHEITTYFDTDELALLERGFTLRIRKSGRRVTQTLKQTQAGAGTVGQRREWEWPLATAMVDPRPLAQIAADVQGLDGAFALALPKFVTDIRRRAYSFDLEDGTTIEAAFDHGFVAAGSRREAIDELELEIKAGPPAPAYRLARDLAQVGGVRIGTESKADRGYRLLAGRLPRAQKSRLAEIPDGADLQEALGLLIGAALAHFTANMAAARAGDVEGVHQTRVALRRVRTALVLFGPYLERIAKSRFSAETRKMGAILGAARDWDVFVLEVLTRAAHDGVEMATILPLRQAAVKPRRDAHAAVERLIDGVRPTHWALGLEAWVAGGDWRRGDRSDGSDDICSALPRLLDRIRRKVRKRGRHIHKLSAADLHPLRKSLRKLRYSAEACGALYDRKHVRAYVKHCKNLQKLLGTINDATTAGRLIEQLCSTPPAFDVMLDWRDAHQAQALARLGPAWDKFNDCKPFWG